MDSKIEIFFLVFGKECGDLSADVPICEIPLEIKPDSPEIESKIA